jgi:glyoxylase-like metal-dependent hydrolase (beta-lactamase superfamily II)
MVCLAALAAAPLVCAQQDYSKVEIKTTKLTDTLYMLEGAGGNMGLSVGEDAVFLIDDQYAPLTPKIEAAVAKLTARPVRFVLNTHWHGDHTGGNENLGKAGAVIVAHENVRKRMSTDQMIAFMNMKTKADPKIALPMITFASDLTFHLNGDEVRAVHAPHAHTDGDAVIWFTKNNVVHMGDLFFNRMYPFIDSDTGGSADGVVAGVDKALARADDATRVIPGHGPLGNKADLKAYRDMLATIAGRVREQKQQGKKLEEVIAAKPTAEFDEAWGKGFLTPAKFVEMLYRALN